MGLVIDSSPVSSSVTTHIPAHVCTDGSSSSDYDATKSFDKSIYRLLNMRDDMKVIEYPDRIRTEFDSFIEQCTLKDAGLSYNTAFDSLDEYLGTIGVTNDIC